MKKPPQAAPNDALAQLVTPALSSAAKRCRYDQRRRAEGKVQLGRIYVEQLTLAEIAMLKGLWGFKNQSQVIEVAVRLLARQTRDGLKEIRL